MSGKQSGPESTWRNHVGHLIQNLVLQHLTQSQCAVNETDVSHLFLPLQRDSARGQSRVRAAVSQGIELPERTSRNIDRDLGCQQSSDRSSEVGCSEFAVNPEPRAPAPTTMKSGVETARGSGAQQPARR